MQFDVNGQIYSGTDITIAAHSLGVQKAMDALPELEAEGISCEVSYNSNFYIKFHFRGEMKISLRSLLFFINVYEYVFRPEKFSSCKHDLPEI